MNIKNLEIKLIYNKIYYFIYNIFLFYNYLNKYIFYF